MLLALTPHPHHTSSPHILTTHPHHASSPHTLTAHPGQTRLHTLTSTFTSTLTFTLTSTLTSTPGETDEIIAQDDPKGVVSYEVPERC